MKSDKPLSKAAAIAAVIHNQPMGDYLDVVDAVKKQFGLDVSQRDVEQTYLAMKEDEEEQTIDLERSQRKPTVTTLPDDVTATLNFVEAMGGFDQARTAIDKLEAIVKRLPR